MLVVLWAGGVLLTWFILVAGWFVARSQLSRIGNQLFEDIRGLDATRRLESVFLNYRHDDLLWHATGQDQYRRRGEVYLATAEQIARDFTPYIGTSEERELWVAIKEKLRAFREQSKLTPPMLAEDEIQATTDLLALVHDFEMENKDQMEASIKAAIHVRETITSGAIVLSILTALLLSVGALSLMRRIVRPTLALTNAAKTFGQGDLSAKTVVLYDDEMGALARTFNNMAGDIADREKDRLQFVAMVVHDLKNPVLAIEMATRVLGGSNATEEERRSYLDGIREEVAHLRGIIRDLMDDIQVANGRFFVRKVELDLGALVRQFVETQGKAFATHEIVVKTAGDCTVRGDVDRINRVLTNLVSNAVKYSPRGTRVILGVEKEDSQALLTVCDQGPGIAKDDLKVLFQPFGRGRSTRALAEGTGMGLYVVKQIVEAHDGQIDVQSEPGHGATFQIRLPLVGTPLTRDSLTQAGTRT
jgi:signal transduction histidine kinase